MQTLWHRSAGRTAIGLIAAPWGAGLAMALIMFASFAWAGFKYGITVADLPAIFGSMLMFGFYAGMAAYVPTLVFGIPAVLLFQRFRLTSLRAHFLGGCVCGLCAPLLFVLIFDEPLARAYSPYNPWVFLWIALMGAAGAATYWLVARPGWLPLVSETQTQ